MNLKLTIHCMRILFGIVLCAGISTLHAAQKKEYKRITAIVMVKPTPEVGKALASNAGIFRKHLGASKEKSKSSTIKANVAIPPFHMTLATFEVDSTDMSADAKASLISKMEKSLKSIVSRYLISRHVIPFSRNYEVFQGAQRSVQPRKQHIAAVFNDSDHTLTDVFQIITRDFTQEFPRICPTCTLRGQREFTPHVSIIRIVWDPSGRTERFVVPSDGSVVNVQTPAGHLDAVPRLKTNPVPSFTVLPFGNTITDARGQQIPAVAIYVSETDGWVAGEPLIQGKTAPVEDVSQQFARLGISRSQEPKRTPVTAATSGSVAPTPAAVAAAVTAAEAAAPAYRYTPAAKAPEVSNEPIQFSRDSGTPYYAFSLAYDGAPGTDPMISRGIPGYSSKVGLGLYGNKNAFDLFNDLQKDDSPNVAMKRTLSLKFAIPVLKELLLSTGSRPLRNMTDHAVWGYAGGRGQNKLGQLLENIREDLLDEQSEAEPAQSRQAATSPYGYEGGAAAAGRYVTAFTPPAVSAQYRSENIYGAAAATQGRSTQAAKKSEWGEINNIIVRQIKAARYKIASAAILSNRNNPNLSLHAKDPKSGQTLSEIADEFFAQNLARGIDLTEDPDWQRLQKALNQ